MTAGQSDFPIDTLERLLRDHERRILQMERRPQGNLYPEGAPPVVAVASFTEVDDPDPNVAYYSLDDQLFRYRGSVRTVAEWQTAQGP